MKRFLNSLGWCLLLLGGSTFEAHGQCVPVPDGVVGFWAGDGNPGDLVGANNAALSGNAAISPAGLVNQCFSFDGTNSYVSIADASELKPTNLTIEAWVKFDSLTAAVSGPPPGYQYLIFKKNTRGDTFEGFSLQKSAGNAFEFIVSSASGDFRRVASSSLISTGLWFHVAGVRGPDFIQLYVNGVLAGETNVAAPQSYANTPLYFGTTGQSYDAKLKGSLDEVALYNRALSADEIAAIFNVGSAGKCKSPQIASQPQPQTTFVGGSASFNVEAVGLATLHYQWRHDGADIPGANAPSFTLNHVAHQDSGGYSVIVTNRIGVAASAQVLLSVVPIAAWGHNEYGQAIVPPDVTNVTAIAAGMWNSFALRLNGTAKGWGWDGFGLNEGALGVSNAIMIAAANQHSLVLCNGGSIFGWGYKPYPPSVSNAVAIAGGGNHNLTLLGNGSVVAGGLVGDYGSSVIPAGLSNIVGIAAGADVSSVWKADGKPIVWGNNEHAQTNVPSDLNNVVALAIGGQHCLALRTDGTLRSWGSNSSGQLNIPFNATNIVAIAAQAGSTHSLALRADGLVFAWGSNEHGQAQPPAGLSNIVGIAAGGYHSLALIGDGTPKVTIQSYVHNVGLGRALNIACMALGAPTLRYQWQLHGTNIPGATETLLHKPVAEFVDAGVYTIVLSNNLGTAVAGPYEVRIVTNYDDFEFRAPLTGNHCSANANTAAASKQVDEPDHAGDSGGHSLWWSWIAPTNGIVTIDTLGSDFDTLLAVYTGDTLAGLTEITSDDQGGAENTSRLIFTATAGTEYQIAVDGWYHSLGNLMLNVNLSQSPVIIEQPMSSSGITGNSHSFRVVALGADSLSYRWLKDGIPIDEPAAYSSTFALLSLKPEDSGDYSVIVSNTFGAVRSDMATLTVPVSPPNDQFTNRIFFGGYTNSVAGSTIGASIGDAPNAYSYGSGDVWWAWISPADGTVTADTLGSANIMELEVYWNTGTNLSIIASGSSFGEILDSQIFSAVAGREYVFKIGGYLSYPGQIALNLRLQSLPPSFVEQPRSTYAVSGGYVSIGANAIGAGPLSYQWFHDGILLSSQTNNTISFNSILSEYAGEYQVSISNSFGSILSSNAMLTVVAPGTNDLFVNRIELTGSTNVLSGHNVGFSKESNEQSHAGQSGGASAWWSWLADSNGIAIVDLGGSSFDTLLGIYTGDSVSNLVQVATNDNSGLFAVSKAFFPCVANTAYHIAVDGKENAQGAIALEIQRASSLAPQIVVQPKSVGGLVGMDVCLTVMAYGVPTNLTYLWHSNGVAIANATNSSLLLSNIQLGWSNTGFAVVVSNALGSVTSALATLTVAAPSAVTFKGNWPGYWGGGANDVQVSGMYAYVATDAGLLVLDVSDPHNPYRVGAHSTDSPAIRVAYTNGYACLITISNQFTSARVSRFDVRNVALPKKVAEREAIRPQAVALVGDFVFLGDATNLLTLNTSLQLVKANTVEGDILEFHVAEQKLVVSKSASPAIEIYDASNPTNLIILSTLHSSFSKATVLNNNLYVLGVTPVGLAPFGYDISNPFQPQVACQGPVVGSLFIVSGFAVNNGFLHLFWWDPDTPNTRVSVFDISNPRELIYSGRYMMPPIDGGYNQRLGISGRGQTLFIAAGASGLMILDTADGAHPKLVGQFYTAIQAEDVAIENNYAFVTERESGFHILDVSDPVNPVRLGTYHILGQETNTADKIIVQGRYAYLGVSALNWVQGFEIADISDPSNPRFLGKLFLPGGDAYYAGLRVTALAVEGNLAAMATSGGYGNRLHLIDVQEKTKPRLLQRIAHDQYKNHYSCLSFYRNHLYAVIHNYYSSTPSVELKVYKIDAGKNLALVAELTFPIGDSSYLLSPYLPSTKNRIDLSMDGTNCFLSWLERTAVFDLSVPSNPTQLNADPVLAKLSLTRNSWGFDSESDLGFTVYDLKNPLLPVQTDRYPGISGVTKVEGRYAFIAGGQSGLTILDLGTASATAPVVLNQPEAARAIPGAKAEFFAGVQGTVPLRYQWRFDGTNLLGATEPLLTLTNVQPHHAGEYLVEVSNSVGVVVSANAALTVDFPPQVTLLSPGVNQHYWPGSNIVVTASAFDSDATNAWHGYVASVDFFTNGVLWTTVSNTIASNTLFSALLTNLPPGSHNLRAVAADNEGATNASGIINIIVGELPVFQLSHLDYPVNESNAVVTVTVTRSSGAGVAEVAFYTLNATAKATTPGGVGSYYATNRVLHFPEGLLATNVGVHIVNDWVNRGNRQFVVALSNLTSGWALAYPSNAYVTIDDDDPLTNNFADVVLPAPSPTGHLQVWLVPTNATGQWRFWWETDWRASGSAVSNLAIGNYLVEFSPMSGYRAPAELSVSIANGTLTISTNYYTNEVVTATGSLGVTIHPVNIGGRWRLASQTNWQNSGAVISNLSAGAHRVEFQPVLNYYTPATILLQVVSNQNLMYEVGYQSLTPPLFGGPVALNNYGTITNDATDPGTPYRFTGQIISEGGYASGFVVKARTVLTAAHVVFDPVRLSYVTNVWWLFQRHRGEREPLAQRARGFHVFQGYAAGVASDQSQTNGIYNFNESSIATRNQDVAALYFFSDAGQGGYSGYLVSHTNQAWLSGASLKMIVGYPVEGVAPTNQGRMHRVGPFFDALELVTNQVYRTDQVFSYPGNSGGPVCVVSTNSAGRSFFIPAGVYLGGSEEAVARAIDLDVVDLINRAENSARGGTNSTGGGVILISAQTGGPLQYPGFLHVSVGPPAAIRSGGQWRISPTNYGEKQELRFWTNYSSSAQLLAIVSTNFAIETKRLAGFQLPEHAPIVIVEGATQRLDLLYRVNPPLLQYDFSRGLGITGTAGTAYQIETTTNPDAAVNWQALTSVTLSGTNWIPNTLPSTSNRFFRAKWLSD